MSMYGTEKIFQFDISKDAAPELLEQARQVFEIYDKYLPHIKDILSKEECANISTDQGEINTETVSKAVYNITKFLHGKFGYSFEETSLFVVVASIVGSIITKVDYGVMPISNKVYFSSPSKLNVTGPVGWTFDLQETEPYLLLGKEIYAAHILRIGSKDDPTYAIRVCEKIEHLDDCFCI